MFLNKEAEGLRILRGRMMVWGDSAGAALMLTTALAPSAFVGERDERHMPLISGVIALYPPTNFCCLISFRLGLPTLSSTRGDEKNGAS